MSTTPSISVVIPCYNAAEWLPKTLGLIDTALQNASITQAEIILVDDGSRDNSADVAEAQKLSYPVKVLRQPNQGRFLARKSGVQAATLDYILFIDTRVHIHPDALKFVTQQLSAHPEHQIWNSHVIVAKQGNIIARFGDAITFIGWRRYFANPRTTSYGLADFDHFPKGTTCFFAPTSLIKQSIVEFERTSVADTHANDDTKMIRWLAGQQPINISPQFSCTYHARNTLRQFTRHTYHRGQVFVDGFLSPGNRFYYPLLVFLASSFGLLIAIIIRPALLFTLLPLAAIVWFAELAVALALRVPPKDALSLFALTPLFAVLYGAGIWRAVIRKYTRI